MREQRDGRGSALMLMPAAVLILMVLAAITVDFSVAFLGERELSNATSAAANDAVAAALDQDALRGHDELRLDQAKAEEVVLRSLAGRSSGLLHIDPADVTIEFPDDLQVRVTAGADVEYVFSKALPGAPDTTHVQATSTATLRTGP
jgi:Flp pilus assembly protein TadG